MSDHPGVARAGNPHILGCSRNALENMHGRNRILETGNKELSRPAVVMKFNAQQPVTVTLDDDALHLVATC